MVRPCLACPTIGWKTSRALWMPTVKHSTITAPRLLRFASAKPSQRPDSQHRPMGKTKLMLATTTQGSATQPPLVLLHGFLGSSYDWRELLPHLSQDYYCIAVDLPGHGRSCDIQIDSPGFSDCVALLRHTLLKAGIPRFHLLGYSLGGRIALHLAQTWPEALLSLHLESCHPGLLSNDERRQRRWPISSGRTF